MSGKGHPLPRSDEARHDEIPEHLEEEKGCGDDAKAGVQPAGDAVAPDGELIAMTPRPRRTSRRRIRRRIRIAARALPSGRPIATRRRSAPMRVKLGTGTVRPLVGLLRTRYERQEA